MQLALIATALLSLTGEPELLFTVPWDAGLLRLQTGPTRGPTALALGTDGAIWILDGEQVSVFDEDGRRISTLSVPAGDLIAVADDGTVAVFASHLGRITVRSGRSERVLDLGPHLRLLVRNLGFVGEELESENVHGERFELGSPAKPRPAREVLRGRRRGPVGSTEDCGVRVSNGDVLLFTWPARRISADGRVTPQTVPLDLHGVSAARPVTACSTSRGMLLEIERVTPGSDVQVWREVALVVNGKVRAVWPMAVGLYQPRVRFAQRGRDVVGMVATEAGLEIRRWRLP